MDIFLTICALAVAAFLLRYSRPLTAAEVQQLAGKLRDKAIHTYFQYDARPVQVDGEFKSRMNGRGSFYPAEVSLRSFPVIAAGLLKSKKHEWIIIGFEKKSVVELMWLNKGQDRSSVSPYLPEPHLLELARQHGYQSVVVCHNHPNSNPRHYNCTGPSAQDLCSAKSRADLLNPNGVNVMEFVCERGLPYCYYAMASHSFLPVAGFISSISQENGSSWLRNLSLHIRRLL